VVNGSLQGTRTSRWSSGGREKEAYPGG
jgi:hypothetical protein